LHNNENKFLKRLIQTCA